MSVRRSSGPLTPRRWVPFPLDSGLIPAAPAERVEIGRADDHPDVTRGTDLVPHSPIEQTVGESVDLKVRGVRVVITGPSGAPGGIASLGVKGIVRPYSTASWRARVERTVAEMGEQGEHTLVLCTGPGTRTGAMRLLPKLPEVCFVEAGDFTGVALRRAVEHGVTQVVCVGAAGGLTGLADGVTDRPDPAAVPGLLAAITTDIGGPDDLAGEVAEAGTPRHAYALWESAGLLGRAGRELCRRVAGSLESFADATPTAGTSVAEPRTRATTHGSADHGSADHGSADHEGSAQEGSTRNGAQPNADTPAGDTRATDSARDGARASTDSTANGGHAVGNVREGAQASADAAAGDPRAAESIRDGARASTDVTASAAHAAGRARDDAKASGDAAGDGRSNALIGGAPGGSLAAQVVLVDATGHRMVAMYGRLAR
jgi:hypothetical protein